MFHINWKIFLQHSPSALESFLFTRSRAERLCSRFVLCRTIFYVFRYQDGGEDHNYNDFITVILKWPPFKISACSQLHTTQHLYSLQFSFSHLSSPKILFKFCNFVRLPLSPQTQTFACHFNFLDNDIFGQFPNETEQNRTVCGCTHWCLTTSNCNTLASVYCSYGLLTNAFGCVVYGYWKYSHGKRLVSERHNLPMCVVNVNPNVVCDRDVYLCVRVREFMSTE